MNVILVLSGVAGRTPIYAAFEPVEPGKLKQKGLELTQPGWAEVCRLTGATPLYCQTLEQADQALLASSLQEVTAPAKPERKPLCIPTHEEAMTARSLGKETPLSEFVLYHEPSGRKDEGSFRRQLAQLLAWVTLEPVDFSFTPEATVPWIELGPISGPPRLVRESYTYIPISDGLQHQPHDWAGDGERCAACGDKDWRASASCSGAVLFHTKGDGTYEVPVLVGFKGKDFLTVPMFPPAHVHADRIIAAAAQCP